MAAADPEKRGSLLSSARDIAYEITRRVNEEGSYTGLLLRYGMERSRLDARDRGLVSELVYGVQRHRGRLDYLIDSFSRRSLEDIDPAVMDILRLGIYQLSDMRIPQHAAVNESVALAKRHTGRGSASFVNAVMRRASEDLGHLEMPDRKELYPFLGTVYSYPRWLVEYLVGLLGPEEAEALCSAQNEVPGLTLRANTSRIDAPAYSRTLCISCATLNTPIAGRCVWAVTITLAAMLKCDSLSAPCSALMNELYRVLWTAWTT